MYTLYTDKKELFEAAISVSGTSLAQTACRLMVECEQITLCFPGVIDEDGRCTIPVKALAKYLPEGTTGTMRLEVIAENTFFVPWESPFTIKTDKKVTVEVKQPKITTMVEAKAVVKKPPTHEQNVAQIIKKHYKNGKSGNRLNGTLAEVSAYIKSHDINESEFEPILNRAFALLTESKKSR